MDTFDTSDLDELRDLLEAEKFTLEQELSEHGKKETATEWEGSSNEEDTEEPDPTDAADQIEELVTNVPLVQELENRLHDVIDALEKMDDDSYGLCEVCNKEIDIDRLKANPAARTCLEHAPKA